MAFSKMVGFEVTPPSPSATMACSAPDVIMPRRSVSYQKLCPSVRTSRMGLLTVSSPSYCDVTRPAGSFEDSTAAASERVEEERRRVVGSLCDRSRRATPAAQED